MVRPNVWRTGDLIGHPVTDPSGATLGRVEEVVVDTVTGRIVYAVCSRDGGPRDGHRVYPVPWSALRLHPDRSGFILDATPERLREAVSFRWDESPDLADPALADRLYRFYEPTAVAARRRAVSDYDLTSGRPLPARASSGTAGLVAALTVMALALGVVFYVLYPRETRVAAESVGRAAEEAAVAAACGAVGGLKAAGHADSPSSSDAGEHSASRWPRIMATIARTTPGHPPAYHTEAPPRLDGGQFARDGQDEPRSGRG